MSKNNFTKLCWRFLKESLLKEDPMTGNFKVGDKKYILDQGSESGITFVIMSNPRFYHFKRYLDTEASTITGKEYTVVYLPPSTDYIHNDIFRETDVDGDKAFEALDDAEFRGRFWKESNLTFLTFWNMRTQRYNQLKKYKVEIEAMFKECDIDLNSVYVESVDSAKRKEPITSIKWNDIFSSKSVQKNTDTTKKIDPEIEKELKSLEQKLHVATPDEKIKIRKRMVFLLGNESPAHSPSVIKSADRASKAGYKSTAGFHHAYNSARGIDQ